MERLRGNESEALKRLQVAVEILDGTRPQLWDRLKGMQNGRRDMGNAVASLDRVFTGLLHTVPTEQLLTIRRNLASIGYTIGVRRPGGVENEKDFGMWLSWETINALLDASRERCIVCSLVVDEQRKCPLGKALDTLPADKDTTARGCGWYGRL